MKPIDLENIEKIESGFKIPDDYFVQFEAKIMAHVSGKKESKVIPLFYRKQIWISSIAALFLIAIALPVYFNMAKETNLDATTIESYLAQQQNVSTTELIKHLTNEDIIALENNLLKKDDNSEALEDYLLESDDLDYYINEP